MFKILILLLFFVIISNCSIKKNIEHHGVHLLEKKQKELKLNVSNKNDIIELLGPPSVESSFDNDLMFYIERKIATKGIYKLGKREILINNVLVVEVDNRGMLLKKELFDIESMNDLKIVKQETSVDYQKSSFIYDFLSSMRQKVNDPLGKRNKK